MKRYNSWDFATLDLPKTKKTKMCHFEGPLLPPQEVTKPTLVIDLDETLIHSLEAKATLKLFSGKVIPLERFLVAKRPGVDRFLKKMSRMYEIVVFTRGTKDYADKILDKLDTRHCISHRLYRESCSCRPGEKYAVVKDLSRLGRDLRHLVMVDDKPESFCMQPRNGICIPAFENQRNHKDKELKHISDLLKKVAGAEDVRDALDEWKKNQA